LKKAFTIPDLGTITFTKSKKAKYLRITLHSDNIIRVTIPNNISFNEAHLFLNSKMPWIKKQLNKMNQRFESETTPDFNIDFDKAQEELFDRLNFFSQIYNMNFNNATFRCQKTRWGSCSGRNNISLNINIVFLPKELQDYILLHELVHTKIKNHSKVFWNELDKYTQGKAKELSKKLRDYKIYNFKVI